ncbi:glycerophosphodiester phosphodiesterase family protein [Tellurirhabdus rosea]|uniref:glycerophosphodiester phosphodiesterase family protein n=1 Tax=Tellurirhabdus rosea TaxID=2674997 RepID=UPI00224DE2D1|nr:glycerophosphodiester phosphodiesterase family protein [Tellurirhabdus rosea]
MIARKWTAGLHTVALLFFFLTPQSVAAQSAADSAGRDLAGLRQAMRSRYALGVSVHRGTSPLAPENTLAAFRTVLPWQVDYLEIDVRTSRDGQLFILHDGTLERTTTGTGPARDRTLDELKQLSAGKGFGNRFADERIPTLEEVCRLLADWNARHAYQTHLYVDCKDVAAGPLVAMLAQYGLLNGAVFYGSDAFLLSLRNVAPAARRMPALRNEAEIAEKVEKLAPYAFDVPWQLLSKRLIDQLHERGIRVFSDALGPYEQPEEYRKMARLGLDVIQTDHVERLYRAMD